MSTLEPRLPSTEDDALAHVSAAGGQASTASPVADHWRESAARAAARAYEAAYGREIPDPSTGLRWRMSPRVAVTVSLVVVVVAAAVLWPRLGASAPVPLSSPSATTSTVGAMPPAEAEGGPAGPGTLVVHVSGAVEAPGLVELAPGARVVDAVDGAGGLAEGADQSGVNLARQAVDGEHIHVPDVTEGSADGAAVGDGKVLLNIATAEQLEALPGIGPVLAERIVGDREAHGPFASLDDLQRVSGVGPALVARWDGLAQV